MGISRVSGDKRQILAAMLLLAIVATPSFHSVLASHRQAGGLSGWTSPSQKWQSFWLLDGELRTRIFIRQ